MTLKVTLSRAIKIRDAFAKLKFSPVYTLEVTSNDVKDIETHFKNGKENLSNSLATLSKRDVLLFELRHTILVESVRLGISEVINKISSVENQLTTLQNVHYSMQMTLGRTSQTVESVQAAEALREKVNEQAFKVGGSVQGVTKYTLPLYGKEEIEDVEAFMKELRLDLEDLKEKRNGLNASNSIELSDGMVVFLREHGLLRA